MQAMGQAFGGNVLRAPLPMHGKISEIHHQGKSIFRGINSSFKATRYHSLIVDRDTCPDVLDVVAETKDGLIMGLSHKRFPVHGVQFHPESISSEFGRAILKNFLDLATTWNEKSGRKRG
jgi:anthranilate synthase component 2